MAKPNPPDSWATCKVGDVVELKNGFAFKSGEFTPSGIEVIRISNIQDGEIDLSDAVHVKDHPDYHKFSVKRGDLLIAMSGATTGKMGVYNHDDVAFQNQRVGNIKVKSEAVIYPSFRNHFFRMKQEDILKEAYGGAQPNISGTMIENFDFALPPLSEQKRIVAKIESTQEKIKTIEESVSKAEELIGKYRESLLQKAFRGELALFDRSADFWNQLDSEILQIQKRCKKSEKHFPLILHSDVEGWWAIPSHWYKATWNHVTERITYGFTKPVKKVESGVPVVTAKNVKNGVIDFATCYFISKSEFDTLTDKDKPRKGDILITKDGTIGRVAIVETNDAFCINQSVAVVRLASGIKFDVKYLYYLFESPEYQKIFDSHAENSTTIKHLSITDLGISPLPIPSLQEQQKIVEKIDALLANLNFLSNVAESIQDKVSSLNVSILSSAFSGELVPQLDFEGTGHDLLKKIKSEQPKETEGKATKTVSAAAKKKRVKK